MRFRLHGVQFRSASCPLYILRILSDLQSRAAVFLTQCTFSQKSSRWVRPHLSLRSGCLVKTHNFSLMPILFFLHKGAQNTFFVRSFSRSVRCVTQATQFYTSQLRSLSLWFALGVSVVPLLPQALCLPHFDQHSTE